MRRPRTGNGADVTRVARMAATAPLHANLRVPFWAFGIVNLARGGGILPDSLNM
jgi:hypothetical protein